jgi:nicotinate-nucleotide adenylyltransferase
VENREKIGIFGGTFDPVHEGHVSLAEFVLAQEDLLVDQIVFLPAACPPHKSQARASFAQRVAMLETAIAFKSAMAVSVLESRRKGPSFTVDSLYALQSEYPGTRLSFLIGADSLLELNHWYRFETLFTLADLIVVARAGLADTSCYQAIQALPDTFVPDTSCRVWRRDDGATIWYLNGFSSPVSSTEVRQQLKDTLRSKGVTAPVLSYIEENALYR